jgi:hypothetical protein
MTKKDLHLGAKQFCTRTSSAADASCNALCRYVLVFPFLCSVAIYGRAADKSNAAADESLVNYDWFRSESKNHSTKDAMNYITIWCPILRQLTGALEIPC